jgi:hypothetical protein
MLLRWRWLGLAALVAEQAAPLNPLRRLLRRPPPVSDARYATTCVEINQCVGCSSGEEPT